MRAALLFDHTVRGTLSPPPQGRLDPTGNPTVKTMKKYELMYDIGYELVWSFFSSSSSFNTHPKQRV